MMKLTILVFAVVIVTAYAACDHHCKDKACPADHVPYCNGVNCDCKHQVKKRDACMHDSDCAGYHCPHNGPASCSHSSHMCVC